MVQVPVKEAAKCLDELVDRTIGGEHIVLTLEGVTPVRLEPVRDSEGKRLAG